MNTKWQMKITSDVHNYANIAQCYPIQFHVEGGRHFLKSGIHLGHRVNCKGISTFLVWWRMFSVEHTLCNCDYEVKSTMKEWMLSQVDPFIWQVLTLVQLAGKVCFGVKRGMCTKVTFMLCDHIQQTELAYV